MLPNLDQISSIKVPGPDNTTITYWLPDSEDQVITLVNDAQENNEIICLRGSAHSYPLIQDLEIASKNGRPYKFVMLSKMRDVQIDKANKTVRVQAGCNLGKDPYDPTRISTEDNSLLFQLNEAGLALTDLGGIIHQSVGGFMANGCSGGSTQYGFGDSIMSIEIIHFVGGQAKKVIYNRPTNGSKDDPFYGIGINIGVMGVVVAVTFQCVDKFYIKGRETISKAEDCEIDIFGSGTTEKKSFAAFLQTTEYTRIMWWPQEKVHKFVVWQAVQATQSEIAGCKPYHEAPQIMGSPKPATAAAGLLFKTIGNWPENLYTLLGNGLAAKAIKEIIDLEFYPKIYPKLLELFVPYYPKNIEKNIQKFGDVGWKGLPMDNNVDDKLFPVKFTELWIPIERSEEVMNAMKTFYDSGPKATFDFSTEVYAAKQSDYWLSPSYGGDMIRIDIFWFGYNAGDPYAYYQQFWDLLEPFNYRPHWGKYLPPAKGPQGAAYIKSQYPKWDEWIKLRDDVDPDGVFLNDYWSDYLYPKGHH